MLILTTIALFVRSKPKFFKFSSANCDTPFATIESSETVETANELRKCFKLKDILDFNVL